MVLMFSFHVCLMPFQKHNFIHDEAELSEEGERVSSDESEGEHLDKYDESFVDDCTQLSQDAAVEYVGLRPSLKKFYIFGGDISLALAYD